MKALHEAEHQKLDVEIAAMEKALAKNTDQGKNEPKSSDQSVSSKEGDQSASSNDNEGRTVVATAVTGKPEQSEASATSEPAPSKTDQDNIAKGKDQEESGGEEGGEVTEQDKVNTEDDDAAKSHI